MRLLGIDYGTKRVGISITDDGGRLAFPHTTINNNEKLIEEIGLVIDEYKVERVVIGESKDYQMKDNRIMEDAKELSSDLEDEFKVEVVFHPEFMTSMQAEKTHFDLTKETGRNIGKDQKAKQVDAQAAAIMLQSYIDSNLK